MALVFERFLDFSKHSFNDSFGLVYGLSMVLIFNLGLMVYLYLLEIFKSGSKKKKLLATFL